MKISMFWTELLLANELKLNKTASILTSLPLSVDQLILACLQAVVSLRARVRSPANPVAILDELVEVSPPRFVTRPRSSTNSSNMATGFAGLRISRVNNLPPASRLNLYEKSKNEKCVALFVSSSLFNLLP